MSDNERLSVRIEFARGGSLELTPEKLGDLKLSTSASVYQLPSALLSGSIAGRPELASIEPGDEMTYFVHATASQTRPLFVGQVRSTTIDIDNVDGTEKISVLARSEFQRLFSIRLNTRDIPLGALKSLRALTTFISAHSKLRPIRVDDRISDEIEVVAVDEMSCISVLKHIAQEKSFYFTCSVGDDFALVIDRPIRIHTLRREDVLSLTLKK